MNYQVEVTWQKLRTVIHSIMVHTRVSDKYIHFALIYTTDNISPVITIELLVNHDDEPTTPHKLATATKTLVSNPCVLFPPVLFEW